MNLNRRLLFTFLMFIVLSISGLATANAQEESNATQIAKNAVEEVEDTETSESRTIEETEDKPQNLPLINSSEELKTENTNSNILHRIGIQTGNTLPLTLNDAIRRALQNNNDIEIAKSDVQIAESNLRSLLGVYDGVFTISPTYDRNSTTGQNTTRDVRVNSDFTGLIKPGGGNYRFFYNNNRTENAFAQAQATQGNLGTATNSALFFSSIGVSYNQPILRNFETDQNRRQIKIQRKRIAQSDADFRRRTIEIISQVQRAYWDLVFALRDQQNRVANLNLSKENLRQIEARIEAGSAAPLARAEVATELANRESEVLVATQQVSIAENTLKQLLLREPTAPEWSETFVPTDSPVFSLDSIDLQLAMNDAIANRPELNRLRLEEEINKIDIDYFKNQTKPRLDFISTLSFDGLARSGFSDSAVFSPLLSGSNLFLLNALNETRAALNPPLDPILNPVVEIPPLPAFLRGGYFQATKNIFRNDSLNYTVGVTFSIPFRNQTAKADLATAQIQQNRIDAQSRQQEQIVITEVRNAVQAVETARQRVLTARRARENAEIQLAGERKLFEVGRSTTFLLFQRENALANARNAEIRAETDYNKALSDLQRATSTTFRANNIIVDSPSDDN